MEKNPYLPFILFTGTVTDFRVPGDSTPITEIFISPLHTGSERTGYVPTPPWRSLSKSAALAAAASDAFVIGMLDRARCQGTYTMNAVRCAICAWIFLFGPYRLR